ncbi:MAG: hypothetical protein K2H07_07530, partial [Lachnospiraceae bacterium]|nr:hypothetical protein [Lachnospiraceae bacterium]
ADSNILVVTHSGVINIIYHIVRKIEFTIGLLFLFPMSYLPYILENIYPMIRHETITITDVLDTL